MDEKPAPSGVEAITKYRAGGIEWNDLDAATAFVTVLELLKENPRIEGHLRVHLNDAHNERMVEKYDPSYLTILPL